MAERDLERAGARVDLSQRITINVMTVMDVEAIAAKYGKLSQDPKNATQIGHQYIYMSSDDPRGWSAADPGNIILNAQVGDTLDFFCTSTSGNSEDASFIIALSGGAPVLDPSHVDVITLQKAAQPTPDNGYPFQFVPETYSSCDAKVRQTGTATNFWATAALFTLSDDSNGQVLAGYVTWDPTVIVK